MPGKKKKKQNLAFVKYHLFLNLAKATEYKRKNVHSQTQGKTSEQLFSCVGIAKCSLILNLA